MDIRKVILVVLGVLILAGACSDNQAVRLRYEAERLIFPLEKMRAQVLRQRAADSVTIRELAAGYRRAAAFCTAALDSISADSDGPIHAELAHLAFRSFTGLSQTYFRVRRYDSSVAILTRLSQTIPLDRSETFTTRMNIGQSLQSAGTWDSAQAVYRKIIHTYYPPVDDTGGVLFDLLNLPFRLYRIVRFAGDSTEAAAEYQNVESYYQRLISDYPDSRLSITSHGNLARLYEESGDWNKAINQLRALSNSGSGDNRVVEIKIADILGARLGKKEEALALYKEIGDRIDPDDSLDYPLVRFKIAIIWMQQKKFSEARRMLIDLKESYPYFYLNTPLAQLTMARSFEFEGKWNRARAEYVYLIEQFPTSDEALSAPLHLAEHYSKIGSEAEAERWMQEAEELYERTAKRGAGSILEAKTLIFKADLYMRRDDNAGAIKVLTELFDSFPGTEPGRRALVSAARIYREELDNPNAADSLMNVLKAALSQNREEFEI